jgi:hypothetical protein
VEKPERIGRYQILECVGRGGMGTLFRGWDPVLDREVAIKVMRADFSADEGARDRFYREARAAARLQHRHIVTIFEFAEEDHTPYIVMEFLRGTNLAVRVAHDPPLSLEQKIEIVEQLCTGLHFAHAQGVVHRDVKPANIFVEPDGTVKLLDFGIARVMAASTLTRGGHILGSAYYMAPEQVSGAAIDGRADLFSAGVVLYELLSGVRPWEGGSPTAVMMRILSEPPPPLWQLQPHIPPALAATVDRALSKDPGKRHASGEQLASDLRGIREALAGGRTPAPPKGRRAIDVIAGTVRPALDRASRRVVAAIRDAGRVAWAAAGSLPIRRRWVIPAAGALLLGGLAAGALRWTAPSDPPAPGEPAVRGEPGAGGARTDIPLGSVTEPAPAPSVIRVESRPAGAAIAIDAAGTGLSTPADVSIEAGRPQRLRLTRAGYEPLEIEITDEQRARGVVTLELKRLVRAEAPPSAAPAQPAADVELERRVRQEAAGRQALAEAERHEAAGDLRAALARYQEARALGVAVEQADAALARLRGRMLNLGEDAFTRARQYDALGRTTEAIALYGRAVQLLPDDDDRRRVAANRIETLQATPRPR